MAGIPSLAPYDADIVAASNNWNIDPNFLRALILQESRGNPRALSPANAYGLTQVIPSTATALGVTNINDPTQQIYAGAKYLSQALDAEQSPENALRFYHGGPGWRGAYGQESQNYVPGVLSNFQRVQAAYPVATTPNAPQPAAAADDADLPTPPIPPDTPPPASTAAATPGQAMPDQPMNAFQAALAATKSASPDSPSTSDAPASPDPSMNAFQATVASVKGQGTPVGNPGDIDPLTGEKMQFAGNVPANDPVGQSTGKPIAENQEPGAVTQAAIATGSDREQQRRIAASELFPDLPEAEAESRVFYGPDGRMSAVGANGTPFYVEPMPENTPSLGDTNSPGSIASTLDLSNLPARIGQALGASPAVVGGAAGSALGGGPIGTGAGAAAGDVVRQIIARHLDPRGQPVDYLGAAETGAGYGLAELGGRMLGDAFLPTERGAFKPNVPDNPLHATHPAQAQLDAPRFVPNDVMSGPISPREAQAQVGTSPNGPVSTNPLAADPNAGAPSGPLTPGPSSPTGIPVETPPPDGPMTPEEAAANAAIPQGANRPLLPKFTQEQAEKLADQTIQRYAGIGNRNPLQSTNIPGVQETLADSTRNPGLATLQRGLQAVAPDDYGARIAQIATNNKGKYATELADIGGDNAKLQAATNDYEAQTGPLKDRVFANRTPVDAQPVVDKIDSILNDPQQGEREAITQPLTDLRARLFTDDGTLKSDPLQLYGFRQHLADVMSPKALNDKAAPQAATQAIMDVKNALDPVIESGAPGFQDYLSQTADRKANINGMELLQGANLTDAGGNITIAKLDNLIKRIQNQQSLPGARKADSISDDQMSRLLNMREQMRRELYTSGAGKIGSGTTQDLNTGGRALLTAPVGPIMTPLGSLAAAGAAHISGLNPLAAGAMYVGTTAFKASQDRFQRMYEKALLDRVMNVDGKGFKALQTRGPVRP